jgi:phosphate transport system substrate-binding protein
MNITVMSGKIATAITLLVLASVPLTATAQNLEGAGSTFVGPYFLREFARYKQETGTSVNYQVVGSGAGYIAFKNKTADFGASDAPMTAQEEGELPGKAVQFPVIGGAVVMTYNLPGVATGLKFTPEIIAGMYLGKIKTWNDAMVRAANPGVNLPPTSVLPVHRTDGSGTTYVFTNYLKKANAEWAGSIGAGKSVGWPVGLGGKGNQGVAAVVRRTPGGIGYNELAYAIENGLPYGSVRNHAGKFITPTIESTTAGVNFYAAAVSRDVRIPVVDAGGTDSYPITGLVYVFLYDTSPKAAQVTKLFKWLLEPAQQQDGKALQYAPLPESLVKLNLAKIKAVH